MRPSIVAFYLPQFHPIPENDEFIHPGFTEWTALATARELFRGHELPVPGELGFYDLRLAETRRRQAELASAAGISAFCYWHYWLGDGRVVLDTPLAEVIRTGEPQYPFCLGWANHSWGDPARRHDRTNIEQRYPHGDAERHFFHVLPVFRDTRYFRVDGKLLFYILRPERHPELGSFVKVWRSLARSEGIGEICFVGPRPSGDCDATATAVTPPLSAIAAWRRHAYRLVGRPTQIPYQAAVRVWQRQQREFPNEWPSVMPNWDHTVRVGRQGRVLTGSTPGLFRQHLLATLTHAQRERIPVVFLKSWNEWGEGNYVEPDRKYGRAWLGAIADAVKESAFRDNDQPSPHSTTSTSQDVACDESL